MFYFESKYRRGITVDGLLGFVVFTDINSISGSGTLFISWHPAAGTDLHIKINNSLNTNIGLNYDFSIGYQAVI